MDVKKFLISGIVSGLVIIILSFVFNFLVNLVFPYNALALGGMRSATDPLMPLFFISYWVIGFALTYVYLRLGTALKGGYAEKGTQFGILMWLVATVPSSVVVYSSMDYPIGFTINQLVGGLLYMLAAGIVIAWLQNQK